MIQSKSLYVYFSCILYEGYTHKQVHTSFITMLFIFFYNNRLFAELMYSLNSIFLYSLIRNQLNILTNEWYLEIQKLVALNNIGYQFHITYRPVDVCYNKYSCQLYMAICLHCNFVIFSLPNKRFEYLSLNIQLMFGYN